MRSAGSGPSARRGSACGRFRVLGHRISAFLRIMPNSCAPFRWLVEPVLNRWRMHNRDPPRTIYQYPSLPSPLHRKSVVRFWTSMSNLQRCVARPRGQFTLLAFRLSTLRSFVYLWCNVAVSPQSHTVRTTLSHPQFVSAGFVMVCKIRIPFMHVES